MMVSRRWRLDVPGGIRRFLRCLTGYVMIALHRMFSIGLTRDAAVAGST
jgi:hypothetical protein